MQLRLELQLRFELQLRLELQLRFELQLACLGLGEAEGGSIAVSPCAAGLCSCSDVAPDARSDRCHSGWPYIGIENMVEKGEITTCTNQTIGGISPFSTI